MEVRPPVAVPNLVPQHDFAPPAVLLHHRLGHEVNVAAGGAVHGAAQRPPLRQPASAEQCLDVWHLLDCEKPLYSWSYSAGGRMLLLGGGTAGCERSGVSQ